jgi:hypothetical protein
MADSTFSMSNMQQMVQQPLRFHSQDSLMCTGDDMGNWSHNEVHSEIKFLCAKHASPTNDRCELIKVYVSGTTRAQNF